jgi:hypothetical protein
MTLNEWANEITFLGESLAKCQKENQRLRGLLREINQTVKICPICGAERWYWDISGVDKKVRRGSKIAHHDDCELAKELSDA